MSGFGAFEIEMGGESFVSPDLDADFHEPAGAAALVWFDAPARASLAVYEREIADGALTCALGRRRAMVRMEPRLAARIVTEALRAGLTLPEAESEALRDALG
ncbi:hypothetical protein [Amaricoccus sp. W119]|uniref:hypothetical protein n=1 Tax=Amaricoccus sp. W119 TaxID=3391833 RepID=UPI0039A52C5F